MSETTDPEAAATVEKIRAETKKLLAEAQEAARPPLTRPTIWIPLLLAISGGAGGILTGYFTFRTKTAEFSAAELAAGTKTLELDRKAHELTLQQEKLERTLDALDTRRRNLIEAVTEAEQRFAAVKQELNEAEQRLASATSRLATASGQLGSGAQPQATAAALQQDLISARTALGSANQLLASQLLATANTTVFLQFRGDVAREVLRGLQASLVEAGVRAPGIERVAGDYANEVRYFHAEDRSTAEAVAARVQAHFNGACRLRSPVKVLPSRLPAPRNQVEVWIGATEGDCRG